MLFQSVYQGCGVITVRMYVRVDNMSSDVTRRLDVPAVRQVGKGTTVKQTPTSALREQIPAQPTPNVSTPREATHALVSLVM